MKKLLLSILVITLSVPSIIAQAKIEFAKTKQKFGIINQGDVVTLKYTFTNTGNQPLIINDIEVECTCTTAEKPESPIPPNETGIITITFDTQHAYNRQDRTAIVNSNDPKSPTKLRFKGVVLKK